MGGRLFPQRARRQVVPVERDRCLTGIAPYAGTFTEARLTLVLPGMISRDLAKRLSGILYLVFNPGTQNHRARPVKRAIKSVLGLWLRPGHSVLFPGFDLQHADTPYSHL